MAIIQTGSSAAGTANVDANYNLQVRTPTAANQAGYTAAASIMDAGSVTGAVLARGIAATRRGFLSNGLGRAEVSQPTPLFTDTFNYAAQDTGRWNGVATTFVPAWSGGLLKFNSTNLTTASAVYNFRTYATFPIPTEGSLHFRCSASLSVAPQANNTVEMGLFYATTTTAPTDGVLFRYDSTGTLKGVCNYNGSEITSSALTAPTAGVMHWYEIILTEFAAEFWIDGVLQATVASGTGTGQPMMSPCVQIQFREYNAGSTPASAQDLAVADVDLWATDGNINRPSTVMRPCMGMMGYQGVAGMAMGQTALYANSANPTAAVPTNTSAALGTGLGGNFWETASVAVNTDAIISSFQVPAGTVNIGGRKLVITGIRWMSMVQTVLAGGPFVYQCGLAFGHTAVSLATGEAAGTKAPRRIGLGLYTLAATAAVGTLGANFQLTFNSPIVVNPGEFVATIVRNIGTVGSSGTIAHVVGFDAHWD